MISLTLPLSNSFFNKGVLIPHNVTIEAKYLGDASATFAQALDLNEMADAMSGLATYHNLPEHEIHEGESFTLDVTFWGLLRFNDHKIFVEEINHDELFIQSRERGHGINQWDHHLSLHQEGPHAIWRDQIIVDAGWMTRGHASFAAYAYKYRHKNREALEISTVIKKV